MRSRWLSLAAIAVVLVDGLLLWTGVIDPATAIVLFLAVEAPLGVVAIARLVSMYRQHRRSMTPADACRAVIDSDPLLRAAAFELATAASLARWVARRPDVPVGAIGFGYARGSLATPLILGILCVGEIAILHLILPWPLVRLAADLLGVYALLSVLGLSASRVVRPHLIGDEALQLRQGVHVCGRIRLDMIRDARNVASMQTKPVVDDGRLELPGPTGSNVELTLNDAVDVCLPTWPWAPRARRPVTSIRLQLDEPDTLIGALSH